MRKQWEPSAVADDDHAHYDDYHRDNLARQPTTISTTDRKGHQSDGRQLVLTSGQSATRTN
jgi:hypothetical protein